MAVALVPDQAIFNNISLVRIRARFMDDHQKCIRWCRQYGLLAAQMVCLTCRHHCREQALDRAVDGVTWRCPVKACKKRFSIITWQSSCGIRDLKNILPLHLAWTKVTQQNSSTLLYELNGKNKSKKWHFKSHK